MIVDLSHPHVQNPDLNGDQVTSVNSGINVLDFPAIMTSSTDLLNMFLVTGAYSYMSKQDWNDAYKHIPVHPDDLCLQYIGIGGMFFQDCNLTFGAVSSPGIYDRAAKVILKLSVLHSNISEKHCKNQLDDALCVSFYEDCMRWFKSYRQVCSMVGVSLAEPGGEKAFEPTRQGVMLGINYNLDDWTWSLAASKTCKILYLLYDVVEKKQITLGEIKSLSGKITHYASVFEGKFERGFVLRAAAPDLVKSTLVEVDDNLVSQCKWWIRKIYAASVPCIIPDPRPLQRSYQIHCYSDAAGGGCEDYSRGFGGVVYKEDGSSTFIYHWWEGAIQSSKRTVTGDRVDRKLSFLEGIAALATLICDPPAVSNRSVVLFTDNIGLYYAYKSGSSRCLFTYTIVKALSEVARGLNVILSVEKVPRCSNEGSIVSDLISKGLCRQWLETTSGAEWGYLSLTLMSWVSNPAPTRCLGIAILREMSLKFPVLVWSVEDESELSQLIKIPRFNV